MVWPPLTSAASFLASCPALLSSGLTELFAVLQRHCTALHCFTTHALCSPSGKSSKNLIPRRRCETPVCAPTLKARIISVLGISGSEQVPRKGRLEEPKCQMAFWECPQHKECMPSVILSSHLPRPPTPLLPPSPETNAGHHSDLGREFGAGGEGGGPRSKEALPFWGEGRA